MNEWKEYKLGELIDFKLANLQTGPFGTMLNASEYSVEGIPVIAVQDTAENKLVYHKFVYVSQEIAERLNRYRVKENDIIFGRKGATDRRAIIKKSEEGWLQGSDCIRLRLNNSINSKFISYQFGSNDYKEWISQFSIGATMPSLNQDILKLLPIRLPSIEIQNIISEILNSFDDKINLLYLQNNTLVQLAETVFKKWFVINIDVSWKLKTLQELCTITRGASPRPIIEYVKNGTVPWIKIADGTASNSFFIDKTNEYIIEEGASKSVRVYPGDLILSNSATCGFPFFIELEGCIHDGWLLFRDFKEISKLYLFFLLKGINSELNNYADGSVQNNLNTSILKEYQIHVPPINLINKFNIQVGSFIEKIKKNNRQIRTLQKLRDTLLPKLMSGEVRVKI